MTENPHPPLELPDHMKRLCVDAVEMMERAGTQAPDPTQDVAADFFEWATDTWKYVMQRVSYDERLKYAQRVPDGP